MNSIFNFIMKQTKLLFLLLLLMAIPATMQAYTQGEIVKKDGLIYQVIDLGHYKLSFVGTESSVSGTITVPASFQVLLLYQLVLMMAREQLSP